MKYSIQHFGLISILARALFISVGCSKGESQAGVQPAGIPPNELAEPVTPNAPAAKSDVTKQQQSNQMPMPGQANDHSTLDPHTTQRNQKP
jgi:hypothetical protein